MGKGNTPKEAYRAIQLSVFRGGYRRSRGPEIPPTVVCRDSEIPPTGELNAS